MLAARGPTDSAPPAGSVTLTDAELEVLRAEIAGLRAGLLRLREGLADSRNTNIVDYIDALLSRPRRRIIDER
jgi:hypothetical protein